jgi:hypothetical protein
VLLFVLTLALQALERLRDRQDKDSRRVALLAELSANNSTLKALQQQQTGAPAVRPDSTNMLTSSRTIGLGARVAATRAPDGSHVPHDAAGASARKRRGGTVACATTTALSSSSSEGSDSDYSCSSGSAPSHAAPPVPSPPADEEQQQTAAAPPSNIPRSTSHKSLASRQRDLGGGGGKNGSSSSSSSEDEDTNASAAGDSLLTRGPTVAHPIPRSNEARDARLKLPIVAEEQPLMDLVQPPPFTH